MSDESGANWLAQLSAAKSGNQDTLSAILLSFASELRALAKSLIHAKWRSVLSDDDLMQETYAEAFGSIKAFAGTSRAEFGAWLKQICRNNYVDAGRALSAKKRGGAAMVKQRMDDSAQALYEAVCSGDSPSMITSKQEAMHKLSWAIGELPRSYANVIMAIDIRSQSASDVAEQEQCSVGAVYMRRNRGLRELKRILGSSVEF